MVDLWLVCIMSDHIHMIVRINGFLPFKKHLGSYMTLQKTQITAWKLSNSYEKNFMVKKFVYIIYTLYLCEKNEEAMSTSLSRISQPTRRKLIDIPEDVFRALSMKSAAMGINLKKYIERLLEEEAAEMDDAEIYRYLVATHPEGKQKISEEEKDDFMRRHGIGPYR